MLPPLSSASRLGEVRLGMRPGGDDEISSASSHDGSGGRCLPIAQNFPCPLLLRACTYKRGHWPNVRSCGIMLQDDFAHLSAQIDSRSGVNAHGSVAPALVVRRRLIGIVAATETSSGPPACNERTDAALSGRGLGLGGSGADSR